VKCLCVTLVAKSLGAFHVSYRDHADAISDETSWLIQNHCGSTSLVPTIAAPKFAGRCTSLRHDYANRMGSKRRPNRSTNRKRRSPLGATGAGSRDVSSRPRRAALHELRMGTGRVPPGKAVGAPTPG
jgi:hypothetical protein